MKILYFFPLCLSVSFLRPSAILYRPSAAITHRIGDFLRCSEDSLHHLEAIFRGGKLLLSGVGLLRSAAKQLRTADDLLLYSASKGLG